MPCAGSPPHTSACLHAACWHPGPRCTSFHARVLSPPMKNSNLGARTTPDACRSASPRLAGSLHGWKAVPPWPIHLAPHPGAAQIACPGLQSFSCKESAETLQFPRPRLRLQSFFPGGLRPRLLYSRQMLDSEGSLIRVFRQRLPAFRTPVFACLQGSFHRLGYFFKVGAPHVAVIHLPSSH